MTAKLNFSLIFYGSSAVKISGSLKQPPPPPQKQAVCARNFVHFRSASGAPLFSPVRDILVHSAPQKWTGVRPPAQVLIYRGHPSLQPIPHSPHAMPPVSCHDLSTQATSQPLFSSPQISSSGSVAAHFMALGMRPSDESPSCKRGLPLLKGS